MPKVWLSIIPNFETKSHASHFVSPSMQNEKNAPTFGAFFSCLYVQFAG